MNAMGTSAVAGVQMSDALSSPLCSEMASGRKETGVCRSEVGAHFRWRGWHVH
eukprot:CAMPEP_0184385786 /NCGR_PEP_ID=MMETSP0007-20130409/9160_1 /TAXON_ID=97485 /ORGANISM="Prymnesium parvum, Strain Texoma1" /LENGTH=52 /DNA_ID=CAMNT_0026733303 /DNA_START=45 /DNA_END=200 /DNA_ORIENTATION=+